MILYTNNELSERGTKKTIPFIISSPKKLGINLTKDLKDLHTENIRHWWKKLNRHKSMERYPVRMGENIVKTSMLPKAMYTYTQPLPKFQWHFTETKQTILTFVWSHKGPRRAKATLRKENGLEASRSLTSHFITKLQYQKSVELAQKQVHRPEEHSRESRNKPTGMWSVNSQERSQEHTPGKGRSPQ